jgi:starvation-inducible DNA-binding protein
LHTFDDYQKTTQIKSIKNISDGNTGITNVLDSFKTIIIKQRDLLNLAAETDDEGTNALMSDYIREQEKLVWMYSSFLNR